MGDLTKNLSRWEVKCRCKKCKLDTIDFKTVQIVQETVNYFSTLTGLKLILVVTSGCRCETHNRNEGGWSTSQHLRSRALDFFIKGIDPNSVYHYLNTRFPNKYGIGNYSSFTHFDTKSGRARRW